MVPVVVKVPPVIGVVVAIEVTVPPLEPALTVQTLETQVTTWPAGVR